MIGKKIVLRAVEPRDLDVLYKWENDINMWQLGNTLTPFSKHVLKQYILKTQIQDIHSSKQLRMMIDKKDSEETLGIIDVYGFEPQHKKAGIGILIEKEHRQKGFAMEAIELIKKYCFEILNLHQLYCEINQSNQESLSLFRKAGFIQSGIKKDWLLSNHSFADVCFLQIIHSKK